MTSRSEIPRGEYCYELLSGPDRNGRMKVRNCPYWSIDKTRSPDEDNGYCSYLKKGDWDEGYGMFWDQIKECGINRK